MSRICFDTEFIEDGYSIELISIGMVRDNGATYYAEIAETNHNLASPWVRDNVLPYLTGSRKPKAQVASEIVEFVGPNPQFWAWYASYDWIALCQLFGTMMDLPRNWPMFVHDYRMIRGNDELPQQSVGMDGPEHNALSDAKWLARAMTYKDPTLFANKKLFL